MRSTTDAIKAISLLACATLLNACAPERDSDADLEPEITLAAQRLSASSAADRATLALRWAPIHYQDVDPTGSHALSGRAAKLVSEYFTVPGGVSRSYTFNPYR